MTSLTDWFQGVWLRVMAKKKDESGQESLDELRHLCHIIKELKDSIMIASATLDASVANLTAAVNAAALALASANPVASTPDTVVTAYVAAVDAQTVALASATPPPTPVPTPTVKR